MIRPLRWLAARFRRRPPPRRNYDILAPERPLTGAERDLAAQRAHDLTVRGIWGPTPKPVPGQKDCKAIDAIWGPDTIEVARPLGWDGQPRTKEYDL